MNWATGVPAGSTVPGKSTRRHHISVDVPAPATAAVPRSPDSLAAGPQRRIVRRHFKPSQACQACVFLCIQCLPVTPGWNLSACVTVRHEAAFGQRAQLSPQECRGRGSTCKGNTQLHASVDAAHERSFSSNSAKQFGGKRSPTFTLSTARAGFQPSICNKTPLHLHIPCGHKQTCSQMHTDATSKVQRVTRDCVWLRADLDATGPIH